MSRGKVHHFDAPVVAELLAMCESDDFDIEAAAHAITRLSFDTQLLLGGTMMALAERDGLGRNAHRIGAAIAARGAKFVGECAIWGTQ